MVEGADKVGFFVGELSVGTLDGAMVGETVGPRVGKEVVGVNDGRETEGLLVG